MALEWEQAIVDARNPGTLGHWWCEALGWVVVDEDAEGCEIRATADRLPGLLFLAVPGAKPDGHKNRLHLDLRPDDQEREVARLLGLGATRAVDGEADRTACAVGGRGTPRSGALSGHAHLSLRHVDGSAAVRADNGCVFRLHDQFRKPIFELRSLGKRTCASDDDTPLRSDPIAGPAEITYRQLDDGEVTTSVTRPKWAK